MREVVEFGVATAIALPKPLEATKVRRRAIASEQPNIGAVDAAAGRQVLIPKGSRRLRTPRRHSRLARAAYAPAFVKGQDVEPALLAAATRSRLSAA